jgi:hypothetical protein
MNRVKMDQNGAELIELGDGTVITLVQHVQRWGDKMTRFLATEHDLISLAESLVKELLDEEFWLELGGSSNDIASTNYVENRLSRVLDWLPQDRVDEMVEKVRLGREKNKVAVAEDNRIHCLK